MQQQDSRIKSSKETEFFAEYVEANRYKIVEVIGKGSYGVVCAAIDTHTGEKVAIKKVTNIFEHISDAIRILREVKLLRLLRHPDIVDIKRIMMPPSRREYKDIFVVFELMESDLHQVIKANDDLTHEHYRFFLYQMLRALKYMHTANVYHRDLKPKNILANANCKLKICDFGLARVAFNDTPTAIFWTDYVATRWYRAPELCGSFCSKYTPAIDIWSIGCIFAEVLTGKPLFPGKSVVHQLELITDLLGTPSEETIAGVRNEKARKYLSGMRKKHPVVFSEKFRNSDPLALRLLQRLLAFDPKDRPTAEQALADPYFKGLSKVEREPSCQPISKMEFEFESRRLTKEDVRELIYREILEYHPKLLKDYMSGNDGTNYVYPSAIGHFRRQFAYIEENSGKSGPVIPLARKHTSLPRSTVNSSTTIPKSQQNYCMSDNKRNAEESSGVVSVCQTMSRPPPRVPAGPVLPYENGRSVKDAYNGRFHGQNPLFPPQAISPQYSFRSNTGKNQEKSGIDAERLYSQSEGHVIQHIPSKASQMDGMNINNPCYQSQARPSSMGSHIAIDANLLQAQSQFGAVSAASLAVAAHRDVGAVQYGMT